MKASPPTTDMTESQSLLENKNDDISTSKGVCINMAWYSLAAGVGAIAGVVGAATIVSPFLIGHYDLNDCPDDKACYIDSFKITMTTCAAFGAVCGVAMFGFFSRICSGSFDVKHKRRDLDFACV